MPPSRRRILALLAAASVPLAGCNGTSWATKEPTPTPTEAAEAPGSDGGDGSLPPFAYLRHDEPSPIVRHVDDEPTHGDHSRPESYVVDSAKRAGRFEYADVDGVESVRAFVDDTDFDTETIVVDQRRVESCYRLDLCEIAWTESDLDLDFARVPLPYDVPCEADRYALEARFVRLPEVVGRFTSRESSIGSHECANAPDPVAGSEPPGSRADDGTSDDGTTDGGTTDDGTSDDGTTDGGTSVDGTSDDGTSVDGTSNDGTTDGGTSVDGTSDDGTSVDGTTDDATIISTRTTGGDA